MIIPVYNRAGVLRRAIDSVLEQDFRDFELIVVDDRSTDGSAAVARECGDPRLRVIELATHAGSNAARNAGIRESRAELIAFLDSDDVYLPTKLSTVVDVFEKNPHLHVLVDSFVKMGPRRIRERRNPRISSRLEFRRRLFRRELWKSTSAITVKREAAIRAGLFDESVSRRQDLDFLIRLSEFANCEAIDETLWIKHWSADSISADGSFVPATLKLVARHPQFIGERLYRAGLSRDLARHLLILLRKGRIDRVREEAGLIVGELGGRQAVRLLASGTRELARRAFKRRRAVPRRPVSRESRSPRNRASARS